MAANRACGDPLRESFAIMASMQPTPLRADGFHPWYPANMNLIEGHDATCPHCWETISVTLDLSVPEQSYVEDCPVCCKPMLVSYTAADGELSDLSVEATD
jgi:hypothetical protein